MQHDSQIDEPVLDRPGRAHGIDPEWLSDSIGAIYDCVLRPDRWSATIEAIARQFSFSSSVLGIIQTRRNAHELRVHFGFDAAWIGIGDSYMAETIELWGGATRVENYPLDEPILASEVTRPKDFKHNRYYRDILEPRGLAEAVVVTLARGPHLLGYLGMNRHASAGDVRPEELEGIRLLAPHLRRAVTISNFFDLKVIESATFGSVLDGMSYAVILVDDNLGVVHANRVAVAMFAKGDLLRTVEGQFGLRGRLAENALRAAVRLAAEDEAQLSQRGMSIPAQAGDGVPAVVHVLPLHRGDLRSGLVQRAVAAIFVVPTNQVPHTPVDAIALLYDLTPAESQIFAALCKGLTLAHTAEALGIARSTAKTHLLRVFDKTGCKRQAELVALAARLSLTI